MVLSGAAFADKPNIIFILADDIGYGDLASYGHPYARTPRLDQLANEGIAFRNFHVSGVVCSPSRTGFMTGIHPARFSNYPAVFGFQSQTTITEVLKHAGYQTGHFGKWHIGPQISHGTYGIDQLEKIDSDHSSDDGRDIEIFDQSIEFIEDHHSKPFFINIWTHSTHTPVIPTQAMIEKIEKIEVDPSLFDDYMKEKFELLESHNRNVDDVMRAYLSEVFALDIQIGRVLDRLEELGLTDNTIVIFSSDHGPAPVFSSSEILNSEFSGNHMLGWAGGFRGGKHASYEGGVRTPFIVRWPDKIPAGQINASSLISALDFLPTLSSIVGIDLQKDQFDGEDVSDIWAGATRSRNTPLFWRRSRVRSPESMLDGHYKLHRTKREVSLYDLSIDSGETTDISDGNPKLTAELLTKLDTWTDSLPQDYARKTEDTIILGPAVQTPIVNPPSR